jgi:hypothetical protein
MSTKIDLTGKKFGRLTVLGDVGRCQGHVVWKCRCDCGGITEVIASSLRKGITQSCGCLHKEQLSKLRRIELIGQRFGRLTVLEDVGRMSGGVLWKCQCSCGTVINVRANALRQGGTKSCGCYKAELLAMRNRSQRQIPSSTCLPDDQPLGC